MKHRPLNRRTSRGVALITALLILTIATTASVYLARQEHMSIRRTTNVINGNQAYQYALGGEALAMTILHEDRKENEIDSYVDPWSQPIPPYEAGGFLILGSITDLQSRFNINNLVNEDDSTNGIAISRFRRLIAQFGIEPDATDAVVDWIDRNINPGVPHGAEDDYYLGLEQPYRTANGPMQSVSELRLVKGFNVEGFNQLAQHLTALPAHTEVNLNTAPPAIWMGIDPNPEPMLIEQAARQPVELFNEDGEKREDIDPEKLRAAQPYESVVEAMNAGGIDPDKESPQGLSVDSEFFLVEVEVHGDRARAVLKSVLHRSKEGIMRVVMRSQGGL